MKNFLLLCGLLLYSVSFAQTLTEKWNSYNKQYEYFNSNNQMIGYKKYDSYTKSWLYYDVKPQVYEPRSDVNFELWKEVLQSRQNQYDANKKGINDYIVSLRNTFDNSDLPQEIKDNIRTRFNSEYIDVLKTNNYDVSYPDIADQILQWLSTGINKIVKEEITKYNNNLTESIKDTNQSKSELNYYSGGYTTTEVITEKYNPFTKEYEFVSKDNTISKIYFNYGNIYYFRNNIGAWKLIPWNFLYADPASYTLTDMQGYTLLVVGKHLGYVEFLENPVGGVFTNKYTYRNLKKDVTITKPF